MKNLSKFLVMLLAAVVLLAGCTKKSSEKKILSFLFFTPAVEATVMEDAKTIVATMPAGTDLSALVPIITVSDKATVNPASGLRQDFTDSVIYTVTAEDGTQTSYTVAVTVENGGNGGGGNNGGGNGGGGNGGDNGEETECTISLVPSPYTGGTVSGDGTYQNGQSCTITARPAAGYAFEKWEKVVFPENENDPIEYVEVSTEATYTFIVTSSGIYYARFVETGGGSSDGRFSVSETKKVHFAPGNLQYKNGIWRFAEHQYDIAQTSDGEWNTSDWIDLFGWGTWTGSSPNPYNTSLEDVDYSFSSADFQGSVAGYESYTWRTLTRDEWVYVFNIRSTPSGIRYAKAKVNELNGVILLPDDWNASTYALNSFNTEDADFSSNVITALQWMTMENAGAVFLPAAGWRYKTESCVVGLGGYYWSSYAESYYAYFVHFVDDNLYASYAGSRHQGVSVRLVCSAE